MADRRALIERIDAIIERSKDDSTVFANSEVRELAHALAESERELQALRDKVARVEALVFPNPFHDDIPIMMHTLRAALAEPVIKSNPDIKEAKRAARENNAALSRTFSALDNARRGDKP